MKGQGDFLNAAVQVAKACPAVRFVCIGEGPEERRLKRLASELGIQEELQFAGPTRDPVASLNGLDICCSPSLSEGFSNSIAEAMACGVPCVVTDVGDSARIVGDLGIVVPRSHPDSLATGILQAVEELPRVHRDRVRARIVANFSVATMVQKTIGLFNQLDETAARPLLPHTPR
jgi:glycosyltransferase involved in cell wall biosynthesis